MHRMLANTFQTISIALIGLAGVCPCAEAQRTAAPPAPAGMALIPAGIYKPLFRGENELKEMGVVIPLSDWLGHNNGPDILENLLFKEWCWTRARARPRS